MTLVDRRVSFFCAVGLATGLSAAPLARGQEEKADAKQQTNTVLVVERAALSNLLSDPKDRALRDALAMFPTRLKELPGEVPGADGIPAPVVDLFFSTVSRGARLGVTYSPENPEGGLFGFGVVLSFETAGKGDAEGMESSIRGLLAQPLQEVQTKRSESFASMTETTLPIGRFRFGPRETASGAWRYELHAGSLRDPDTCFAELPKGGEGFTPLLNARLNFAALTPLANMVGVFAARDPGAQRMMQGMAESGLVGEDAVSVTFQAGNTADRTLIRTVIEGLGRFPSGKGAAKTPIGPADLAAIPADAHMAAMQRMSIDGLVSMIEEMRSANRDLAEGLKNFQEMTGVDPVSDVLGSLGTLSGFYTSDSTGGGSLASTVVLVSLKDAAKLRGASDKLVNFANAIAAGKDIKGYVRARRWSSGGVDLVSITFPGIPLPIEPTFSITDGWLVVGAMPQAALVGARQAMGKGGKGLGDNPAFAAMMPHNKPVVGVQFADARLMMRRGYPLVSMLGSAVSNGMRSPRDSSREPGVIVPTFGELSEGAKSSFGMSYWDGDNLVIESHSDRSMVVSAAVAAGQAATFWPVVAAAIGGAAAAQEHMGRHGGMNPPMFRGMGEHDDDEQDMGDEESGRTNFMVVPAGGK